MANWKTHLALHMLTVAIVCSLVVTRFVIRYRTIYKRFINAFNVTCTTVSSQYISTNLSYPCLQIFVQPALQDTPILSAVLFENEDAFHQSSCTFHPSCPRNKNLSRDEIENYKNTYGIAGSIFSCYHQDDNISNVIRTKVDPQNFVHIFFWPDFLIFIILCFILFAAGSCCRNLMCARCTGATEVYQLRKENGKLQCPCSDESQNCCAKPGVGFGFYRQQSEETLLGVLCKRCWKECLAEKFLSPENKAASNSVKVEGTKVWYRPPSKLEFFSFSQVTTKRTLIDLSDLESAGLAPGDHIMWHRPYAIWHHAIITSINNSDGIMKIIQWSDEKCCSVVIHEAKINIGGCSPCKGDMYKVLYEDEVLQRNPAELVLGRARALLGLFGYRFFSRNCENFATFCKTGFNFNHQYPWLMRRLHGLYQIALYLNLKAIVGATTLSKALISEAVELVIDPAQELIGAVIVIILEAISFIVDTVMIYKNYDIGCSGCCSCFICCKSPNDFKKMVWMRIFEAILGAGGMIGGSIGLEQLVWCSLTGFGHFTRVALFGVMGGSVGGVIGKYAGNLVGYSFAKYCCYQCKCEN